MAQRARDRIRRAGETLEMLRSLHPLANASPEAVAALHELHAAHQRDLGEHESADEALGRAARARKRARQPPP